MNEREACSCGFEGLPTDEDVARALGIATACHCGQPVVAGYASEDPTRHRGMCAHCDPIRCDAYPGECGR